MFTIVATFTRVWPCFNYYVLATYWCCKIITEINSTYGVNAPVLDEHWISTDNIHAFPQPQAPAADIMYSVLAVN